MSCFTGTVVNNQILFDCFITKPDDSTAQADLSKLTPYKALLDTGSTATSITRKVLREVGIIGIEWRYVHSLGGLALREECKVGLIVPIQSSDDKTAGHQASAVFNPVEVLILEGELFNFDVLLGMDIITQFNFQIHDGDKFTLCV